MIFSGTWKVLGTGVDESELTWSVATPEEGPVDEAAGAECFAVVNDWGGGTEKPGDMYNGGAA